MARKSSLFALALVMTLTLLLSACTKKKDDGGATQSPASTTAASVKPSAEAGKGGSGDAPLKELVYPDAFPKVPKPIDYDKSYAYDDMSKHYTLDIMTQGFVNQPATKDPFKDYFEKTFNVTIKFTHLSHEDLVNKVNVRFASGDAPDLVAFNDTSDRNIARTLFKQGQLVEATKVLPYMPQMMTYVTKTYKNWATDNGNMVGIPRLPTFADVWGPFVRQDWLAKLKLPMPKTDEELFQFAKAVTEQDPDGNGKADTWFMGAASGGQGLGMIDAFRSMFGHPSWNVKDGKINNPMLDGTTKNFLLWVKKLNDNKLLAPDWYTVQWEQFKSYTLQNKIGAVNYPGWNLMQEQYQASGNDPKSLDYWAPMPPPTSAGGQGGKLGPGGNPGGMYIISKKAADDEGKLKRIAHFLDALQYPNKYYWVPNQGGGPEIWPDYTKVVKNDDGTYYYDSDMSKLFADLAPEMKGSGDWQSMAYTLLWEVHKDTPQMPFNTAGDKHQATVKGYPRYDNFDMLLSLDGAVAKQVKDYENKNEISFILGKRSFDEWDKYVQEWKKTGGQKLMEQAAEQLKVSLPQ